MAVDTSRRGGWLARVLGAGAGRAAVAVVAALGLLWAVQTVKAWAADPPPDPGPTRVASWQLERSQPLSADDRSFRATVYMGWGGVVQEPEVVVTDDWIVVTFSAASPRGGGPDVIDVRGVTVQLDEAIGDRTLVDGSCLRAEATFSCGDGPVRWPSGVR
jgi:hypothetical protein